MLEINLLPEEQKKKKVELPELPFLPLLSCVIGIIVVIHLLFALSLNFKTRSLRRLEKKWEEILPAKEEADRVIHELTTMRSRISAIDKLIEGRLGWAKKLNDLSDAMIPGVWLNRLWVEKRVIPQERKVQTAGEGGTQVVAEVENIIIKTLHLNGSVIVTGGEETAAVGKFMWSLKNNPGFFADFDEIESAYMQQNRREDAEIMDFELVCYFK